MDSCSTDPFYEYYSELAGKVVELIPEDAWPKVTEMFIKAIVDEMSSGLIEKLTGAKLDFDGAEQVLREYYEDNPDRVQLIDDAIRIIGSGQTLYYLDLLALDKTQEPSYESL